MICEKCGANVKTTLVSCPFCGAPAAALPQQQTQQPQGSAAVTGSVVGVQVPNHLALAIITTVCCCLPFGIPAIVFASQVNTKLAAGDIAGARESSRKAKFWSLLAIGLGLLLAVIWGALNVLVMIAGPVAHG